MDWGTYFALSKVFGGSGGGGGGTTADSKAVNFIDYDGTVQYSYTAADALALTELPANPSNTGLTAQGWNWSLADIKTYLTKYPDSIVNVGQMYTTDDGKTRLYIYIDDDTPANRMTFYVRFKASTSNNTTIDWGDGTSEVKGSTSETDYAHTYASTGHYTITLTVNSGTISFIGTSGNSGYSIYGSRSNSYSHNRGRIRKVEIGNNVTSIGNCVFNSCYSLTSITIPDSVTSIGDYAFNSCYSLTSITIPDSVTSIGVGVFQSCYSLTSIKIPYGVTRIGTSAFSDCYSLTSITIPDSVTSIGPSSVFYYCFSLTSITIPDGVTSIGTNAFQSCYSLTSITIPDGVTSIESYAFYSCYSLTSITIPDSVTSIVSNAFYNCYSLTSITIPDGVTIIGGSTFYNCCSLTSITIPDGVTSIGGSVFYNCYSLTSITIPDGVKSIGGSAFYNCYSLTSITIPNGVTSIGASAFYNCYAVSEYHLLSNTPPTLSNKNAFTNIASDCIIYVPYSEDHSVLNAYKTATNWSTYASYMQEEPQ